MTGTEPRNEVVTLLICSREYGIFRLYGSWTNWNCPLHHMSHIISSYLMPIPYGPYDIEFYCMGRCGVIFTLIVYYEEWFLNHIIIDKTHRIEICIGSSS